VLHTEKVLPERWVVGGGRSSGGGGVVVILVFEVMKSRGGWQFFLKTCRTKKSVI